MTILKQLEDIQKPGRTMVLCKSIRNIDITSKVLLLTIVTLVTIRFTVNNSDFQI